MNPRPETLREQSHIRVSRTTHARLLELRRARADRLGVPLHRVTYDDVISELAKRGKRS